MRSAQGFRALEELRASGAVRAIGIGEGPPCDPAVTAAVIKTCPVDYICLAASFSLLEQPVHDDGILQQCLDNEVGAVIFAPFNSGILVRSPLPCCQLLVRVLPGQTSDRL